MPSSSQSSAESLDPSDRQIAEFLTLDIQNSPEWAQDLADHIEAVRRGDEERWERFGNAYELTLTAEGAAIADAINETGDAVQVSLEHLAEAVQTWIENLPPESTQDMP